MRSCHVTSGLETDKEDTQETRTLTGANRSKYFLLRMSCLYERPLTLSSLAPATYHFHSITAAGATVLIAP